MKQHQEKIPYPKQKRGITSSCVEFCKWAAKQDVEHCIEWPLGLTPRGYGRVRYQGRRTSAHRIVLEMAKGKPPSPKHVAAHEPITCHNPACVNPNHLRWATHAENAADKRLDGTNAPGGTSRGVSRTPNGKWRAYIYADESGRRKYVHVGVYDTEEAAEKAAKIAREQRGL